METKRLVLSCVFSLLIVLLILLEAEFAMKRYRECRAHGFSKFYCLTQR